MRAALSRGARLGRVVFLGFLLDPEISREKQRRFRAAQSCRYKGAWSSHLQLSVSLAVVVHTLYSIVQVKNFFKHLFYAYSDR